MSIYLRRIITKCPYFYVHISIKYYNNKMTIYASVTTTTTDIILQTNTNHMILMSRYNRCKFKFSHAQCLFQLQNVRDDLLSNKSTPNLACLYYRDT